MFITKSLSLKIFKRYDLIEYHRMYSWLWMLTYGYLLAQSLKTNTYVIISPPKQTSLEFVYDLLNMLAYSVCMFYFCELHSNDVKYQVDSLLYIVPYTTSITAFMYLGEVKWLKYFVVEWGFWDTLDNTAIIFLSSFSFILICLIMRQCMYRESNWLKLGGVSLIYVLSWIIIDCFTETPYVLHLHHAFLAIIFSILFSRWTNKLTFVIHSICMGVWVEGMNVIGTEELEIFMKTENEAPVIDFSSSMILFGICASIGLLTGVSNFFFNNETLL